MRPRQKSTDRNATKPDQHRGNLHVQPADCGRMLGDFHRGYNPLLSLLTPSSWTPKSCQLCLPSHPHLPFQQVPAREQMLCTTGAAFLTSAQANARLRGPKWSYPPRREVAFTCRPLDRAFLSGQPSGAQRKGSTKTQHDPCSILSSN